MELISTTPIHDLLASRSNMEWGVAPKYNEAYRKLRWPGRIGEVRLSIDPDNILPGSPRATFYAVPAPDWLTKLESDKRKKSHGNWRRNDTKYNLRFDLIRCMKLNIPFKTKSIEYKPIDQWIYVYGNRTLRYDIRRGAITEFTYSGVYNKVTTLVLRMFSIPIKLIGRKLNLFLSNFNRSLRDLRYDGVPTIVDIYKIYTSRDLGYTNPIHMVDRLLDIEYHTQLNTERN